jgi:phage gp46-like protein
MPVDFAIQIKGAEAQMTFDQTTSLGNNVYLSLMVKRGSFFQDPNFGSRLYLLQRAKNTARNEGLAIAYAREALAWLVSSGRATKINVTALINPAWSIWGMKFDVQVFQASGQSVTFTIYTPVV